MGAITGSLSGRRALAQGMVLGAEPASPSSDADETRIADCLGPDGLSRSPAHREVKPAAFSADLTAIASLQVVPDLLLLLAETTAASPMGQPASRQAIDQLAAELTALIMRYGTAKPMIEAIATGHRKLLLAALDRMQSWQQIMAVTPAALDAAFRRHNSLHMQLRTWLERQPADFERRLDRYAAWLDENDATLRALAQDCAAIWSLHHARHQQACEETPAAAAAEGGAGAPSADASPAACVSTEEPRLPFNPPPLALESASAAETLLIFVIDAKHPAEQLESRSIDLEHAQLARQLRQSADQIERLIGAIVLSDFEFADAVLAAHTDRLGAIHAARLRGDRYYWEGRFSEAVPHYRAHLDQHDDLLARCNLACALLRSEQGNRAENAEEAITLLRQTIALIPRDTPQRARVLMLLGAAREIAPFDTAEVRKREALRCYEEALHALTRERDGIWWAGAHLHAGLALLSLAASRPADGSDPVHRAINHFQSALEHWTRDSDPAHWSTVQNNLGRAWERLHTGDRRRNLEKAKACFESALEVRTREDQPAAWARLQNNLGNLHLHLPHADSQSHIHRAIEHHIEAARVWSAIDRRSEWAATQYNLGNAYALLPAPPSDPEERQRNLHRAIACYRSALEVQSKAAAPLDWATTMNNLGSVLVNIPDPPGRADHLEEAIRCFRSALEVRQRDRLPLDWARTIANLAQAVARLPTGERSVHLSEALNLINQAMEEATPARSPELHRQLLHRRELIQRERAASLASAG